MLTVAQAEEFTADVLSGVLEAQNAATTWKPSALGAALIFQASWRCFVSRKRFIRVRDSCLMIQRVRRGYVDRRACQIQRKQLADIRAELIFGASAIVIQRHYRGLYSRKYVHNYYARKAYLERIRARGDATVKVLREEQNTLSSDLASRQLRASMNQFDLKASQLHHLVSTKAIPGVLNPPFPLTKPQSPGGELVEDTIKRTTHEQLKKRVTHQTAPPESVVLAQPRKESLLTSSADAGRQRWLQGPFKPPAVLVASLKEKERYFDPFNAALKKERLDAKMEKLTRIAPVDFVTRHVRQRPFPGGVNASSTPLEPADLKFKK